MFEDAVYDEPRSEVLVFGWTFEIGLLPKSSKPARSERIDVTTDTVLEDVARNPGDRARNGGDKLLLRT